MENQTDLNQQARAYARNTFEILFNELQTDVRLNNIAHGFINSTFGERIALIHSELSEALEADRKGIEVDSHVPELSAKAAELADVVIRVMDLAAVEDINLADAILKKHAYNKTRPYKHGGKKY